MKLYSKQYFEAMESFEKWAKASSCYLTDFTKPTREESKKLPKDVHYNNGTTNMAFTFFLNGIAHARCMVNLGEEIE